MKAERLRIGEVAAQSGVNIQTLRYYERIGLVQEPKRSRSGYREYPSETVRLMRFIKRAQQLGFSLSDVEELLKLRLVSSRNRVAVQAMAEARVRDIDEKLARLTAMREALGQLLTSCACSGGRPICPILEALEPADEQVRSGHVGH